MATILRAFRAGIAFACMSVAAPAMSQECSTPLPSDTVVAPGSAHAVEGREAFLGAWGNAKWDGVLCHTLVVESLPTESSAVVVYSHGAYSGWNIKAPGFFRLSGRMEGSALHLSFPAIKARAEYRIVDGKLHGQYFTQQGVSSIVMDRKQ